MINGFIRFFDLITTLAKQCSVDWTCAFEFKTMNINSMNLHTYEMKCFGFCAHSASSKSVDILKQFILIRLYISKSVKAMFNILTERERQSIWNYFKSHSQTIILDFRFCFVHFLSSLCMYMYTYYICIYFHSFGMHRNVDTSTHTHTFIWTH